MMSPTSLDTALIRSRRVALGLSQDAAARAVGYTGRAQWNNLESGLSNPSTDALPRIADLLHVSIDELFGRKLPKKPK